MRYRQTSAVLSETRMNPTAQLPADQAHLRIPIHVITGFLGSGKTRLLNQLLQQAGMRNTAVIVNEFGDLSIDHLLVESATEDIMRLAGGCLCCSVRTDLVRTLEQLFHKRQENPDYAFAKVVIETSGLADPAPILRTLLEDQWVAAHFRLENVITTVDAVYGAAHLQDYEESVKQVALANHLILTKTDLPQADSARLLPRLRQINPAASLQDAQQSTPQAATLLSAHAYRWTDQELNPSLWLQAERYKTLPTHHPQTNAAAAEYADYIRAFCLEHAEPLPWKVLELWIQQLTRLRGRDLLRIKGIAYTQETDLPVVIQGVQHILQPPTTLSRWIDPPPRTQIVFITRNISQLQVKESLQALLESRSPAEVCQAAMILLTQVTPP